MSGPSIADQKAAWNCVLGEVRQRISETEAAQSYKELMSNILTSLDAFAHNAVFERIDRASTTSAEGGKS